MSIPIFSGATVQSDGQNIIITVNTSDSPLISSTLNIAGNFYVYSNGQPNSVLNATLSGNQITLNVNNTIGHTEYVIVSYYGNTITDSAGLPLITFAHKSVTNSSTQATSPQTSYFLAGATNTLGDFYSSWSTLSENITTIQSLIDGLSSDQANYATQLLGTTIRHMRQTAITMTKDIQSFLPTVQLINTKGAPKSTKNPASQNNGWNF